MVAGKKYGDCVFYDGERYAIRISGGISKYVEIDGELVEAMGLGPEDLHRWAEKTNSMACSYAYGRAHEHREQLDFIHDKNDGIDFLLTRALREVANGKRIGPGIHRIGDAIFSDTLEGDLALMERFGNQRTHALGFYKAVISETGKTKEAMGKLKG